MSDDHDETGRTAVGGPSRRQLLALGAAAGALAWSGPTVGWTSAAVAAERAAVGADAASPARSAPAPKLQP